MRLTFFLPIVLNLYLQRQATEMGNKPKEERRHRMDSCHKISHLLLQTSFSDLGDITFLETKSDENVAILD